MPPHPVRRGRAPVRALVPLVLAAVSALVVPASARAAGSISGRVVSTDDAPLDGVAVELVGSGRSTRSAADGSFTFDQVHAGSHELRASAPEHGTASSAVRVRDGESASVTLRLDALRRHEEVVVSASADVRGRDEAYQPVDVIDGVDLAAAASASLGETLARQPGMRATWHGPVASRPVVRGLGGDRVRVMENGLEVADASSSSPDHAVALDPLAAERIEIVRGPATLLHGSSAVGGVVNVLDARIPSVRAQAPLSGAAQLGASRSPDELGGASGDDLEGALALDGGRGRFAWHADGMAREADDVRTPLGRLAHSASRAEGGALGASAVLSRGWIGASHAVHDVRYGSPAEEDVTIDLRAARTQLAGEWRRPGGALRALRLRMAASDYEHVELEGAEVGTRFVNDQLETRVEALTGRAGAWTGSAGLHHVDRDFAAIGEESFVPPTRTRTSGVFAFQEREAGAWGLQLGARAERREVDARGGGAGSRTATGLSAAIGVRRAWEARGVTASASASRSVKLPTAEELFSEGPHLATASWEVGDPGLDEEVSHALELGLRVRRARWSAEVSAFGSRFSGFIHQAATGEEIEGLPVLRWSQSDARFHGAEVHLDVDLFHREPHHLLLEISADAVRAEDSASGRPLPRIPPARAVVGLRYQAASWHAKIEGTWVDAQERVAPLETRTPGHALVDAELGWRIVQAPADARWSCVHDLVLRGENLGDELAREHVSFLKDVAPRPGRGASLTYRLTF